MDNSSRHHIRDLKAIAQQMTEALDRAIRDAETRLSTYDFIDWEAPPPRFYIAGYNDFHACIERFLGAVLSEQGEVARKESREISARSSDLIGTECKQLRIFYGEVAHVFATIVAFAQKEYLDVSMLPGAPSGVAKQAGSSVSDCPSAKCPLRQGREVRALQMIGEEKASL